MSELPPFLTALPSNSKHFQPSFDNAVYRHGVPLGPAHVQWWSAKQTPPKTIVLFIPGNPGLLDFYTPFLSALHERDSSSSLAIFSQAHIGHSPAIDMPDKFPSHSNSLTVQIRSVVEAFDALKSTYGVTTNIILIGHSVGAWIALQVLKVRCTSVAGVFLLFPTISNIGITPNGRRLSVSDCAMNAERSKDANGREEVICAPTQVFSVLFRDWPNRQILVLQQLVCSPLCIEACLAMAHQEMSTIRDLDAALLQRHQHKLFFYYAEQDDWVGEEKINVLQAFHPDHEAVEIVHDNHNIPHAFCINHGEQLADQCIRWLTQLQASN